MKWWAVLVFCILMSSYVLGINTKLGLGESYIHNGVNITFAKIDYKNDKVVLCANNQKQILEEDQLTYFSKDNENFMELEVDHIDLAGRTIDIDIGWVNICDEVYCECIGSCLINECKIQLYDQWGSPIKKDSKTNDEKEIVDNATTEPLVKTDQVEELNYVFVISLIMIGFLVGIGLVWLFWFRQVTF